MKKIDTILNGLMIEQKSLNFLDDIPQKFKSLFKEKISERNYILVPYTITRAKYKTDDGDLTVEYISEFNTGYSFDTIRSIIRFKLE